MGILEKLRPQPKHRHSDPAVRVEDVHEIDPGVESDVLVSLAKDDPDARVRRTAVGRVTEASVLADVARNEADAGVREQAVSQLAELAMKHDDAVASAAVAALVSLGSERELANVARATGPEAVRRVAVGGVRDQKLLGGIARHAAEAAARLLSVTQLTDTAEIEAVVIRGEHADAALAALDRISEPPLDLLTSIVQKAKTKAAQKQARSLIKAEERPAEPVVAGGPTYGDADQKRAQEMVSKMAALASGQDAAGLREAYAATRVAWVEMLADADIRPDIVDTFEDRSAAVRDRLAAEEAARAEAERQRQALEREQSARVEVCEQVDRKSVV